MTYLLSDVLMGTALELVEGPTLAERITQGPIPLDEALAHAAVPEAETCAGAGHDLWGPTW